MMRKKIITNIMVLASCMLLLVTATYAWFSSTVIPISSGVITTGELSITVALYKSFDEALDGTLDYMTIDEVIAKSNNNYEIDTPSDIEEPTKFLALTIPVELTGGDTYYYLFEPTAVPYVVDYSAMVLTQLYTYLLIVENTSGYTGSVIAELEGFPMKNGFTSDQLLTRNIMFNEQKTDAICDDEGKGIFYFTHLFGEEQPTNGNHEDNAEKVARGEMAMFSLVFSIYNNPDTDQSVLMKQAKFSATATLTINQEI